MAQREDSKAVEERRKDSEEGRVDGKAFGGSGFGPIVSSAMLGGTMSGLLVWILDMAHSVAGGGGLPLATALLAFYLTLGLGLGLFGGLFFAGMGDLLGWDWWKRVREASARGGAGDAALAAGELALGVGLLIMGGMVAWVHESVSSHFQNQYLAALFLGGVSVVALSFALVVAVPAWSGLTRLIQWMPLRRKALWTLVVVLVGGTGLAAFVITRADWRILNLWAPFALLLVVAGTLAASMWLLGRNERGAGRKGWLVAAGALLVMAGCWVHAASALNRSEKARKTLMDRSWAGGMALALGRRFTDRDGDGYAGSFGGGDCDDSNPAIHPGARDIPGDGIDQDCLAGDAKPPERPVRVDRARLARKDPMKSFRFKGNFLFIIVDTLREDRLGLEKYRRNLTPNLDKLVSRSVFFRHAFSQGNRTPHSFGSFLTSRYPSRVSWVKPNGSYSPLKDDNYMVFEALADAGYRNVAVLRHFYFDPKRNLQQGFAPGDWGNKPELTIKQTNTDIAAPDVTLRAIARLKELSKAGKPFALWVHYPDPHSRYMKHPEFPITLRGIAGLKQKYDYEIKFADKYVGRLLAALDELGLSKNTAVVLWADHGEAFGTHRMKGKRMYFHGQTLYNELLHVPLLFHVPGVAPRVVEDRVMLLDIAPTLVDMLRRPIPKSFMGSSLVPYFFGKKLPERTIRSEALPYPAWKERMVAIMKGRWKLIYRITDNVFELYDMEKDPGEQHNLASRRKDVLARLKPELMRF